MYQKNGIAYYTKCISNQVSKAINEQITSEGLTKAQFDVMLFVIDNYRRNNPIKQRDIENFFHISNPTVSGLLTRLEIKNLIQRVQKREDMRIRYIVPTEEAISLADRGKELIDSLEAELIRDIPEEDIQRTEETLRKILTNLMKQGGEECDQNACGAD